MNFKEIAEKIKPFEGNFLPSFWGNALSGEIGEINELLMCNFLSKHTGLTSNLLKKHELNKIDITNDLKLELADILIYLILIAKEFEIDLEEAVLEKLKIIEKRKNMTSEEIIDGMKYPSKELGKKLFKP